MFVRDFSGDNVFFDSFKLIKGADRHSHCAFAIRIEKEKLPSLMSRLGKELVVTISEDKPEPLFCGTIHRIGCDKAHDRVTVTVSARSESAILDEEKKWQIFQNPEKTLGDMVDALEISRLDIKMENAFKSAKYAPVALQGNETDFAFLLRLARCADRHLWIDDVNQGSPALTIGPCVSERARKVDLEKLYQLSEHRDFSGSRALLLKTGEYLRPGFLARIPEEDTDWLLTSLLLERDHERDIFTYELVEYKVAEVEPHPLSCEHAENLLARVMDNQDPDNLGRIRVNFEDAGNPMPLKDRTADNDRLWLDFNPPWAGQGNGIVFVPDKDDIVGTIFVNGELLASTTKRAGVLVEELRKVSDKAIANNTGQRIFWKEKSLELLSAENWLKMDDKQIELKAGENLIRMNGEGIILQTPKNSIILNDKGMKVSVEGDLVQSATGGHEVAADKSIVFKAQKDMTLAASGGKATLTAGSAVEISGSKVKLG